MTSSKPSRLKLTESQNRRFGLIHKLFLVTFSVLLVRSVSIHLFPASSESLQKIAAKQYQTNIKLAPYRGSIFDRRGHALAISTKRDSFYVNPRVFSPTKKQQRALSKILKIPYKKLELIKKKRTYFSWLKRKTLDTLSAEKIKKLKIKGLHRVSEPARFYPFGGVAANIIGTTGIDNKGLLGIESQFEKELHGDDDKFSSNRDAKGQPIFQNSSFALPEQPGQDITLTIDLAIQEIAEKALESGLKKANTTKGFALVSDPFSGKILALATLPKFDPNNTKTITGKNSRNPALVDSFEPGSIVKPLVVAEALEQKLIKESDQFDCQKGILARDNWRIRDTHPHEDLTPEGILIKSSNIGVFKIAELLQKRGLYQTYKKFGIGGQFQMIGFPGQVTGLLSKWSTWSDLRFANISFGQGFKATALELVAAYGAIANGGKLLRPYLVDHLKSADGQVTHDSNTHVLGQILSPETTEKLKNALFNVVEIGTGQKAKLDLYTAGGKTGTTEKFDPIKKAYSKTLRIASFLGFAPVDAPHLVIYVVVDEPQNKPYYGGKWAAPIFKEIAAKTLKYLNVPPDRLGRQNSAIVKGVLSGTSM